MAKIKEVKPAAGASGTDEGKTIAIISYITWVGLIIAFVMNSDKKNDFAKFHIRQSLMIWIAWIVVWFIMVIPFIGRFLGAIAGIALFVLWLLGLIAAINGEKKEVPILGSLAQDWFKGL
jgi:uncharacterized membrane protein